MSRTLDTAEDVNRISIMSMVHSGIVTVRYTNVKKSKMNFKSTHIITNTNTTNKHYNHDHYHDQHICKFSIFFHHLSHFSAQDPLAEVGESTFPS